MQSTCAPDEQLDTNGTDAAFWAIVLGDRELRDLDTSHNENSEPRVAPNALSAGAVLGVKATESEVDRLDEQIRAPITRMPKNTDATAEDKGK